MNSRLDRLQTILGKELGDRDIIESLDERATDIALVADELGMPVHVLKVWMIKQIRERVKAGNDFELHAADLGMALDDYWQHMRAEAIAYSKEGRKHGTR